MAIKMFLLVVVEIKNYNQVGIHDDTRVVHTVRTSYSNSRICINLMVTCIQKPPLYEGHLKIPHITNK